MLPQENIWQQLSQTAFFCFLLNPSNRTTFFPGKKSLIAFKNRSFCTKFNNNKRLLRHPWNAIEDTGSDHFREGVRIEAIVKKTLGVFQEC